MLPSKSPQAVFVKRVAEVEVDPSRSNQHEFNAGKIRKALGFGFVETRGTISFLVYASDGSPPVSFEESYTLYDARERHKSRTEWRLYYAGLRVAANARAGDLLVLTRPDRRTNDLLAVIARRGTAVEASLAAEVAPSSGDTRTPFVAQSPILREDAVEAVIRPFTESEARGEPQFDYGAHPLVERALRVAQLPSSKEMATAAHGILYEVFANSLDPDRFIDQALAAESSLFFYIERELGSRELEELYRQSGMDFSKIMALALSYSQRRRQRRGDSLQNHFQALLISRGISHTAQCPTEPGETPDFIMPGGKQYHDPAFPARRLRMVGCKTKVRERYRQWLSEAERVRLKFGLCVDEALTDDVLIRYETQLRFFMPKELRDSAYAGRATKALIGTVAELIDDLEAASL